jgi:hypothetical protein
MVELVIVPAVFALILVLIFILVLWLLGRGKDEAGG